MNSVPDIPGHTLTSVLGTGGFATVYQGWQLAVGREVAVKIDNRALVTERDRRRFFREVNAAGRLSGHPHVIDVYDAGTLADGRPYLVMELCPGGSLQDELRRGGPMEAARACWIGARLADALAAAHAAGVLHRDIKPANVLINRYGLVGLSDFGLASIVALSGEHSVTRDALTPAFAPPESFRGAEPSAAADIYSLTATVYALLSGRPPRFPAGGDGPGIATILALHGQPVPDVPGVPPALSDLLRRGLAGDPADRPPTAAILRDELAAAAPGAARPVPAGRPPAPESAVPVTGDFERPREWASVPPGHSAPPARSAAPAHSGATDPPGGPRSPGAPREVTAPAGRRPAARVAALAGALVLVVAGALFAGAHFFGPRDSGSRDSGSRGAGARAVTGTGTHVVGVFGVPTVTGGCPAASVPGAGARCPARPECWNGTVEFAGNETASPLPCDAAHDWETFAIGILPASVSTFDASIVSANPTVREVCSLPMMLRSRRGAARRIPAGAWEIDVLPPDEAAFSSGARAYRCLATVTAKTASTSQFGR